MKNPMRGLGGALTLIAPVQLMVGLIIFVPALFVIWLSLNNSTFGLEPQFVGLANYTKVLSDPYFWKALLNTAIIVLVVVHAELLLGLGMALLFASGLPAKPLLLAIVLAPYAVSESGAVVMWRFLFDPSIGIATQLLGAVGLPALEWSIYPAHGMAMVMLLSIWLNLPFTFIILYAARLSVPGELYEAAAIDGASPWARFRNVTLPLLMPAILIAMLFRYIFSFRLFSEVWLMTGGGPARQTEVVAVYMYNEAFRYNQFGTASATGWLLVIASLALAVLYLRKIYKEMFANASA
jgi:multiple sugar transport system permease protein